LIEDESLTSCGIENDDVIKLDTEAIQNEENINFASKLKNKIGEDTSQQGALGEEDEEGGMMAMRGGMRGGMGGGQMNPLVAMMMGMNFNYEDMEQEQIKRAIKESIAHQQKEDDEKKKKEEEELRKKKEQEEIELQRKKIQEFCK